MADPGIGAALARAGTDELVLATLSDEEYRTLWAHELLEKDADNLPWLLLTLRSLVAKGLAEPDETGDQVKFGPALSMIRQVRDAGVPFATVTWGTTQVRLFPMAEGTVLAQRRSSFGVSAFSIRPTVAALREVVAQASGDVAARNGEAIVELRDPRTPDRPVAATAALLSDGAGGVWRLDQQPGADRVTIDDHSSSQLTRLLRDWLTAPAA